MADNEEQVQSEGKASGGGDEVREGAAAGKSGLAGLKQQAGKYVKILLPMMLIGAVLGLAAVYWISSGGSARRQAGSARSEQKSVQGSQQAGAKPVLPGRGVRSFENGPDRRQYLTQKTGPEEIRKTAVRGDLQFIAGLFNSYIVTLSNMLELTRIITNEYVPRRDEINKLFEEELFPGFINAQQMRILVSRRMKTELGKEILRELDYIAYYDSIAVYSLQSYLEKGNKDEYIKSIENVYQAKLMKKEFMVRFSSLMKEYGVEDVITEELWRRYFGTWDQVEP